MRFYFKGLNSLNLRIIKIRINKIILTIWEIWKYFCKYRRLYSSWMCLVCAGGILAGTVSDYIGGRATVCYVMLLVAAPVVSFTGRRLYIDEIKILLWHLKCHKNGQEKRKCSNSCSFSALSNLLSISISLGHNGFHLIRTNLEI